MTPNPPALETAAASSGPAATFIPLFISFIDPVIPTQAKWGVESRLYVSDTTRMYMGSSQSSVIGVLMTDMMTFDAIIEIL